MDQAFDYFKDFATETSNNYPYKAYDQKCRADSTKFVAQVKSYIDVPVKNPAQVRAAASTTVLSIAVDADSW